MRLRAQNQRPEKGFSLIEVLVSIVVLSFGLLGMAGMQTAAMQSNREARMQANAVQYARELAEMMRGNKAVAIQPTAANNPYLVSNTGVAPAAVADSGNCFKISCADGAALAAWQVNDWLVRINDPGVGLPQPRVATCFDTTPYDSQGVPRWACSNTGSVLVIKIGWTRSATARSASSSRAFDFASGADPKPPLVVLPLSAGNAQ